MGTVGISFGSPTSGAGFNVSTTVASIVANLKNVETPWNTQLTSLKAQDTAISSLGTLFSNLSNDMSSLTDLKGVMAIKTGSSSNTNALTLTAATAATVAGTHTVTITNLASSSSGYLAAIADSSDTLSGSITLQVGSGTAQTIALTSADNTLAGLAKAINASGVGITASVLTDSTGSRLSMVSGTSGAAGNITLSANSIVDSTKSTTITPAYTSATTSTGTLTPIANATSDKLSGTISFTVAGGTAKTLTLDSSDNTLAGLVGAIGNGGFGVTATIVTNDVGSSSLALSSGSNGSLAVTSSIVDTTNSLAYTSPVKGVNANLTVDGVALTSASNTVANLIPGITFQLLAPSTKESDGSLQEIQLVIGNDNTGVESAFSTMVSDYNSLISAMNTQEGLDSSNNSEPLFGSPTLSLLQQQLLGGLNTQNPNGTLDSIATNAGTVLSGSISIASGGGTTQKFVVGSGTNDPATNTYYTGTASGYNTLTGLAAAINAANSPTAVTYTDAGTTSTTAPDSGTLTASSSSSLSGSISIGSSSPVSYTDAGTTSTTVADSGTLTAPGSSVLSGSISIAVGGGTTENIVFGSTPTSGAVANTLYTGTSSMTLSGLATFIQSANIGVTAAAVTTSGTTTLTLTSATDGTAGALTVSPSIAAVGSETIVFGSQPSTGAAANTLYTAPSNMTLSGLATFIQSANLGVTAAAVTTSGTTTLTLTSASDGTAGALTVASGIVAAGLGVTATVKTTGTESTLALLSQTAGSTGALSATSSIVATSDAVMSYSGTNGTDATATANATYSTGAITSISSASDTLSGSLTIEAGSGSTTEFDLSSLTDKTLTGLSNAINNAKIGITASIVTANGASSLSLVSQTAGTAGNLIAVSSLLDTTNTSKTTLNYTNSSDVSTLGNLGISVNNDGSITYDAATLDSVLNTDYSSVVGFFQNSGSWGQSFSTILNNSGSSSTSGILALAAKSNSNIESTLNADISKEELLISAQSKSLTTELNSANEIMQMIPTELASVNELYSAITGYGQNK